MNRAAPLLCLLACLFACSVSAAPSAKDLTKAKELFERGRAAFERADYSAAVTAFRSGYTLVPRPLFLFNEAQALRKKAELGENELSLLGEARTAYRRYIDTSSLDEPERVDAVRHLLEIEGKLTPARDVPVITPPAQVAVVSPPPELIAKPVEPLPDVRSGVHWGWFVAAGVVVVGASAAVGVWAATACHASLGCVDARR